MAAILKTEKIELKIGSSFTNPNATSFHSVRYDYKAKKRDNIKRGTLNVSENNQITIAIPNKDGSRTTETIYQGSAKSDEKSCVLIIDPITGEMTLERLTNQIQVKQTRNSQKSPPQVLSENKRSSRKNNFREAIRRAQQTDKENDQCVPENVAYSVISCPTPDGKLVAKFKKLSTTNDSRVASTTKETKFSADSSTDRKSKKSSDYSKSSSTSHFKSSVSITSKKSSEHSGPSTTSCSSKSKKHSSNKSSSNKHHSSSSNHSSSSKHSSSSNHSSSKQSSTSNYSTSSKHTTPSNHSSSSSLYKNVSHLSLNTSRCIRESNADMRTMVSPMSSCNDGFDLLDDLYVSDSD